jgi:hypothetical protein
VLVGLTGTPGSSEDFPDGGCNIGPMMTRQRENLGKSCSGDLQFNAAS